MQGADLVVAALEREGITHVFGLPGTTIMSIIDALARQSAIRYLSVRHEQVAGFMADGFARGNGRPAVALASRGPGAANLTIAVHNAHDESIPMVVIVGQVSGDIAHRAAFEETDLVSFFAPITKWQVEVHDVDRIPELLQRAVRIAVSGRPGPVLVSIPMHLQLQETDAALQPLFRPALPAPEPQALARAAELLLAAERPVIIAGGGILRRSYDAGLQSLAATLSAPVVTTWMRKNAVPNDADWFLGSLGYGASVVSEEAVRDADVVLALGCRFSEFTTKRYTLINADSAIVQVDIDAEELGHVYVPAVGLHADAALTTALLAAKVVGSSSVTRRSRLADLRTRFLATTVLPDPPEDETPVPSAVVVAALREVVAKHEAILVQDVHTFGPWIQRFVDFDRPGSYYAAAGGAMGWGLPASLGIALSRPEATIVAVHGDGSFFMVSQDLETSVREDIPVVHVVINNFAFGNTRDRQRYAYDERYLGVFYDNPDFAAYAQLLGAYGERVEKAGDLLPALERAIASGRPAVVDVIQDSLEGLFGDLRPPGTRS
jgi:acetolactate synthase I/II/III large subunit